MNKVQLLGRTTKDIELRYTSTNNKEVCNFTLAVNKKFKKEETDFINCVAWGSTAKLLDQYVEKGNLIGVCGSI